MAVWIEIQASDLLVDVLYSNILGLPIHISKIQFELTG
jgi:hypothetical protein